MTKIGNFIDKQREKLVSLLPYQAVVNPQTHKTLDVELGAKGNIAGEEVGTVGDISPKHLSYARQTLSESEQAQARQNIGAAASSDTNAIAAVIPAEASSDNKLTTLSEVDSKIAFNTAHYVSDNGQPFASVQALEAFPKEQLTNNDYAVVVGIDSEGHNTYTYYVYNSDTEQWAKEFVIDTLLTPFTDAQMAALNSGITADKISELEAKGVFVAEYNKTTAQEIMDAYNAGKEVVCTYKTGGIPGIYSQITFASSTIKFYGHSGSLLDVVTLNLNISTNKWARESGGSETTLNPDTATDKRVPTSKAVTDYVGSLEWDGTQAEYDALTEKNPNVTYYIHE